MRGQVDWHNYGYTIMQVGPPPPRSIIWVCWRCARGGVRREGGGEADDGSARGSCGRSAPL